MVKTKKAAPRSKSTLTMSQINEKLESSMSFHSSNLSNIEKGSPVNEPDEALNLTVNDEMALNEDMLGYELLLFIKTARRQEDVSLWSSYFTKALESVIALALQAADDIERQCFISSIYCWQADLRAEHKIYCKSRVPLSLA